MPTKSFAFVCEVTVKQESEKGETQNAKEAQGGRRRPAGSWQRIGKMD